MPNYKVTITLPSGAVVTYTTVGAVTENASEPDGVKTFTGRRAGESADGVITVHKRNIVDQKVEPA